MRALRASSNFKGHRETGFAFGIFTPQMANGIARPSRPGVKPNIIALSGKDKAKDPPRCPPEVQAQSGSERHEKGFWLPYPYLTPYRRSYVSRNASYSVVLA